MNDWTSTLLNSDYGPAFLGGTNTILFILVLTFAIGHFIGYVYMWTHEAISYSRTFVASLAVLPTSELAAEMANRARSPVLATQFVHYRAGYARPDVLLESRAFSGIETADRFDQSDQSA